MLFFKKIISRFQKKDGIFFAKMENLLGFRPKEIHYYEEAFTLGTARSEGTTPHVSYERLEFLGDAILGAVIAHFVFLQAPDKNEGDLTKMRTRMGRRDNLNQIGEQLQLRDYLLTDKKTVLIDNNLSMKDLEHKVISYKSLMVEWAQKYHKTIAFVSEEDTTYQGSTKHFQARVMINEKVYAKAHDTSKKKAEERAAKRAFFRASDKKKTTNNRKKQIKQP